MRITFALIAICCLVELAGIGCNGSSPPTVIAEPVEKPRVPEIKDFDGLWVLKSNTLASEQGVYSVNPLEDGELQLRIKDGEVELRKGTEPWVKLCTLSLGAEPQCLISSTLDASKQTRLIQLRYKLEGNTLTTVQDNSYPDVMPASFEMTHVIDRQRQTKAYVKIDR